MNTLESEWRELEAHGLIDQATATRAVALERREIFSLYGELRTVLYGAVLLLTTGLGLVLKDNLDRLGPLAILLVVALASAACYGYALRARRHGRGHTVVADYVLLLGALLLSADVGYAEARFSLLGTHWSWHLLLLTVIHALTAYAFESSLLLAVALTSLAGWLGVTAQAGNPFAADGTSAQFGLRGFVAAGAMQLWRWIDRAARPVTTFAPVFDHYAAHLAFCSALAWCLQHTWRPAGVLVLAVLVLIAVWRGLSAGSEAFIVYAVAYSALGVCMVCVPWFANTTAVFGFILVVVLSAAAALWRLLGLRRGRAP